MSDMPKVAAEGGRFILRRIHVLPGQPTVVMTRPAPVSSGPPTVGAVIKWGPDPNDDLFIVQAIDDDGAAVFREDWASTPKAQAGLGRWLKHLESMGWRRVKGA